MSTTAEDRLLTSSIRIRGVDGNDLAMSETIERAEIVFSIQQNDDKGRIATVRLNAAQFRAFMGQDYKLEVIAVDALILAPVEEKP